MDLRAVQDERRLDRDLPDDGDGIELGAAHGVEGVAQEIRVRGGDEKGGPRNDERGKSGSKVEREREEEKRRRREGDLQHHQRAEVSAQVAWAARGLPRVQGIESEVGD